MSRDTLGDALPKEIERVRTQIMPEYEAIGAAGSFALVLIKADIKTAEDAIIRGDIVKMIEAYTSLKEYAL